MSTPKTEMKITISSDTPHYAHIVTTEGMSSSEKTISFDSLTAVLGAHAKRSTPMLPNNLLRLKEDKRTTLYMVQAPARKRTVEYRIGTNPHTYDIMTPNLVYVAQVEVNPGDGRVKFGDGKLFATLKPVVTGLEETYFAPFGNIYRNEGTDTRDRICWGNDASLGTTLKMVDLHISRFFLAPFNSDLDDKRFQSHEVGEFKIFKTNHLYAQMDTMFKDGSTEEEVLEYLNRHLMKQGDETVNSYFDSI